MQHLMLQAVQLQVSCSRLHTPKLHAWQGQPAHHVRCCYHAQEEQLQGVCACLEAALQLLSRVGSLGPIEAFFVADELLAHYQNRVGVTHSLLGRSACLRLADCLRPARCHSFATMAR